MINKLKKYSYLSRSVLLQEQGTSFILRSIIWGSFIIVLLFLWWAMHMQLDEVAVTTGKLVTKMRLQNVQHLTGGKVKEILVKDGDFVKKGQLIIRFDKVEAQSQLDENNDTYYSLLARKERLEAYLEKRKPDFSKLPEEASDFAKEEELMFNSLIDSEQMNISLLDSQIKQTENAINALKAKKKTLEHQMEILNDEINIKKGLYEKQIISKLEILKIERDKSQLQEEVMQMPENILKMQEQIKELIIRKKKIKTDLVSDARKELEEINTSIPKIKEAILRYKYQLSHLDVYANIRGTIHDLKIHTVGAIVKPSETMMQIVPVNQQLVAEVHIDSRDVGHIKPGQHVNIKLTTYDFSRYGSISGIVNRVSASSYVDRHEVTYYIGIIDLDQQYIKIGKDKEPLISGMTLQADIKTGSKSLMQYLLKPIFKSASQALRER